MSGRLPSSFCDDSLYMIFKDFRRCGWQGKMLLSSLLLGVERAVKTSAELLLPSRPSPTFGLRMLSQSHQKSNFPEAGFSVIPDVEIWFDPKW